jgi:hypothetical protein
LNLRRGLQRAAIASFIAGAFALGAAHIYVSNLAVGHRFFVYGQAEAFADQSSFFRVSAFANFPPGPLSNGRLEVSVLDAEGDARLTQSVALDALGRAAFSLPALGAVGTYRVDAKLFEDQHLRASSGFELEVSSSALPSIEERPKAAPEDQLGRTGQAPNHQEGLRVELLTQEQRLPAMLPQTVFVRVTEAQTAKPVLADVLLEQVYGQSNFGDPEASADPAAPPNAAIRQRKLRTDGFGLASFEIEALSESDWSITAQDGRGNSVKVKRNLGIWSPSLVMELADPVWEPAEPIRFRIISLYSGDETLYADLHDAQVWLSAYSSRMRESAQVDWYPKGLELPEKPRLVTLSACFSDVSCEEAHARSALLFAPRRLDAQERVAALAAFLPRDKAYLEQLLAPEQLARATPAMLARLERLMISQIRTQYRRPEVLVRSELEAIAVLEASKAEFRELGALLFVCWYGAGGLLLGFWVLRGVLARRKAMRALVDEDDDGTEATLADAAGEQHAVGRAVKLDNASVFVDVLALSLSLVVFAGALLLLYQKI